MSITLDQKFMDDLSFLLKKSLSDTVSAYGITVICKDAAAHENFTDVVMCAVGFTGSFNGNLTILSPQKTACQFVSKMLGGEAYPEVNDEVLDGCREITNMIAGGLQVRLAEQKQDIKIGLPTSLTGQGMHMRFNPTDKYVHQQYSSKDGDFEIYVVCRPSESKAHESTEKPSTNLKSDAVGHLLNKIKPH